MLPRVPSISIASNIVAWWRTNPDDAISRSTSMARLDGDGDDTNSSVSAAVGIRPARSSVSRRTSAASSAWAAGATPAAVSFASM